MAEGEGRRAGRRVNGRKRVSEVRRGKKRAWLNVGIPTRFNDERTRGVPSFGERGAMSSGLKIQAISGEKGTNIQLRRDEQQVRERPLGPR